MYRKYTSEEKLNIVEGYLNGLFSLEEKAHELGYKTAPGCFKRWVRQYQEQGAEGLLRPAGNTSYTAEFKTMVVEEYLSGKGSAVDLAAKHKISTADVLLHWVSLYNANRKLKEYNPKREVYMAEARRKTTSAKVGTAFGNIVITVDGVKPVFRIKAGEQFKTLGMHFANRAHGAVFPKFIAVTQFNISKAVGKVVF